MSAGEHITSQGNLILTGFMGTGKSETGRRLAEKLGRQFLDTDDLIEARAGMTITQIFATRGETAFREMETDVCRELNQRAGLVISTGGGMLLNPVNRRLLEESGRVICLTATPEVIVQRVGGRENRPLLAGDDPLGTATRILAERDPIYSTFEWRVDTTHLDATEVVQEVLSIWESRRLIVHSPAGEYTIHVREGAVAEVGKMLVELGRRGKVGLVSNPTVWALYGDRAKRSLEDAGFHVTPCLMPDGEEHKTLETVADLYDQFLDAGLDRGSTIVALGGGVAGDVAGFAAASFMRGIPVVQMPTTLLSMIDSSVGGKTGVDLPRGKNLVGAFHNPIMVVIDPDVLATLPARELGCGLAETLKTAIIADPALYDLLLAAPPFPWVEIVERALKVKIDVVEEDPFEHGRRATLNLGHTAGHALERLSAYSLPHGEAVAVGLLVAAHIASEMGLAGPGLPAQLAGASQSLGLPVAWRGAHTPAQVLDAMRHDKKSRQGRLRWILPRRVGDVEIVDNVPDEVALSALKKTHTGETV